MKNITYTIEESVFKIFPDFTRAVLICQNFTNEKNEVYNLEGIADNIPFTIDTISVTPSVLIWRKAFRVMGIDPTKDRISFEGLTRRCLNAGSIKNINYIVDLGNKISVKYQCPVGAHPLDGLEDKIALKEAFGNEHFTPLGSQNIEHPQPGELILSSGNNVLTRRFCWRQGVNSILTESTRNFFINFDFLNTDDEDQINSILNEFRDELIKISAGCMVEMRILNAQNRSHNFEIYNY